MDISGVVTVDTGVANNFIRITQATRLMGCESIISGISPNVARTLVELGANVGEVRTTATLRDALQLALAAIKPLMRDGRAAADGACRSRATLIRRDSLTPHGGSMPGAHFVLTRVRKTLVVTLQDAADASTLSGRVTGAHGGAGATRRRGRRVRDLRM